jgi:hypothetical protein
MFSKFDVLIVKRMSTKRLYCFVVVLGLGFTCAATFSQNQFGGKCGPAYFVVVSNNYGSQNNYTKYRAQPGSFVVSAEFGQRILKPVRLMVALEYLFQSSRIKAETSGHWYHDSISYAVTAGTLDVQIMPQFTFGNRIQYYVFPGLYFGRMIHSHYKGITDNLYSLDPPRDVEGSAKGYYPSWDFGFIVGGGIEFPMKENLLIVIENINTIGMIRTNPGSNSGRFINFRIDAGIRYTFNKKE